MNAVGNIAYMVFFWIISFPYRCEHLLAYPTMQLAYAIYFLAGVAGECRHAETFRMVFGILTSHADKLIPCDTKQGRISTHVLAKQCFVKIIVSCRNWRVACVETGSPDKFQRLIECQSLLYIVAQTLQVAQCRMPFVAMIYIFLNAKFLQHKHTANAKKYLLLESVFPVAAIQCVCYRSVIFRIHVVVCVEKIQRNTSYVHSPYISMYVVVHVWYVDNHRTAVAVELSYNWQRVEILRLIVCYLLTVHVQRLAEIAETVEKANSTHVYIAVGCLFQIVAGKHAETTGIDFQYLVKSILHAEVCYRRTRGVWRNVHVVIEHFANVPDLSHYNVILDDCFLTFVA